MSWPRWIGYAGSILAILLASLGAEAARHLLGIVNISLIYLIVVVAVAIVWGIGPALAASLLAAAAVDLLFVPPFGTLAVANPGDWLTLLFFLLIAALTGRLAAGAQARAAEARRRERATAVLYDLSTALIAEGDLAVILPGITRRVAQTFGLDACHILLPGDGGLLHAVAGFGPWDDAGERDIQAIVQHVLKDGRAMTIYEPAPLRSARGQAAPAPRGTVRRQIGAAWTALYLPLTVAGSAVGAMRVARSRGGKSFGEEEQRLLTTFAHQAALAIDKANLAERARRATRLEEEDRVKTALLSSVSHDLRSPLTAIKTAVTTLLEPGAALATGERVDLLGAIDEETDRLTRLVANLLDLSRIQGGALYPRKEWVDLAEIVVAVVDRLAPRLSAHPLTIALPDGLPLLPADYVRIDQVLSNLIENAAAYAPPNTPIVVSAQADAGGIAVRVHDAGPGIPPAERERVFEPFYRASATTGQHAGAGSGLGLAICHGIVVAHGGWIRVEQGDDTDSGTGGDSGRSGTTIAFWLPGAAVAETAQTERAMVTAG